MENVFITQYRSNGTYGLSRDFFFLVWDNWCNSTLYTQIFPSTRIATISIDQFLTKLGIEPGISCEVHLVNILPRFILALN